MAVPMSQQSYRKHLAFCDANPEWAKQAVAVMNRWGTGEVTLAQAIAEALMQAYQDGKDGVAIVSPKAARVSKVIRRTR